MGTRDDMLRKYLTLVGFGSIIFGLIFFVLSMIAMFGTLNHMGDLSAISVTGIERFFMIMNAAQTYGFSMFEGLTLGGVCLYLARKLEEKD